MNHEANAAWAGRVLSYYYFQGDSRCFRYCVSCAKLRVRADARTTVRKGTNMQQLTQERSEVELYEHQVSYIFQGEV